MFSQDKLGGISIEYGEEITEEKGKIVNIIGEANEKIYALGLKGKEKYFLKVFDSKTMAIISNNQIKLPKVKDKKLRFEDLFVLNGNVYIFASFFDRKNKEFKLEAIPVSETGELGANTTNLFSSPVAKGSARGSFYFKLSPDKTKVLALHAGLYSKEDAIKYNLKYIDSNLKVISSHSEKVSYVDKNRYEFDISDFSSNTNDDFFIVTNESHLDKKKNTTFSELNIHSFQKENNYEKKSIKIDLSGNELINCKMIATHNQKLQVVGLYSELRKSGKANKKLEGVYNGSIDIATNTALPFKFNKFDYETKLNLLGERKANKDKDLKPFYNIHSIIEKEDGGLILLSEFSQVIYGKTSGIGPISVTPTTYIKNEIIVTSLTNDGSLDWSGVVAKESRATTNIIGVGIAASGSNGSLTVSAAVSIPLFALGKGPEYLGAIPIYKDGTLTVLYNDNIKNSGLTKMDDIKKMVSYNKSAITAFEFNSTGKLTRIDKENPTSDQLNIRPQIFFDKYEDEYIIYSSKRSVDKLGRMFID